MFARFVPLSVCYFIIPLVFTLTPNSAAQGNTVVDQIVLAAAPFDAAVGEVTGDLFPDIVVIGRTSADVVIIAGDGIGGYAVQPTPPQTMGVATGNESVVVTDMDGDGDDDVAVANRAGGTITLFTNDGSGSFTAQLLDLNVELGGSLSPAYPTAMAATATLGELWISTSGSPFQASTAAVLRVQNPLTAGTRVITIEATGGTFSDICVADPDQNGLPDVVAANSSTGTDGGLHVFTNDGVGGFTAAMFTPAIGTGFVKITAASLDGTGTDDDLLVSLIAANPFTGMGGTVALTSDGIGGFTEDMARTALAGRHATSGNFAGTHTDVDIIDVPSIGAVEALVDVTATGPLVTTGSFALPGTLGGFTGPEVLRLRAAELDSTATGTCPDRDELVAVSESLSRVYVTKFTTWLAPALLEASGTGDTNVTISMPGGSPVLPNATFGVGVSGTPVRASMLATLVVQNQTAGAFGPQALTPPVSIIIDVGQSYFMFNTVLDANGDATIPLALPDIPGFACQRYAAQWVVFDSLGTNGVSISDGRQVVLGFL